MDKRGIAGVIVLVILLGCFFQFSRMDGFLKLDYFRNLNFVPKNILQGTHTQGEKEKYLILYDPRDVPSVFANHRLAWLLEQQKKEAVSCSIYEDTAVEASYRGVLLAASNWNKTVVLPKLADYAAQGGTVAFMMHPEVEAGVGVPDICQEMAGFTVAGGQKSVLGIQLNTDFLFAGKGFSFGEGTQYHTDTLSVTLQDDDVVHIAALDGSPLLWEHAYGQGKCLFYNGAVRDDKTNIGVLTAMLAHCGEDSIYPVVGTKLFFIDDFPAPVPEGNFDKIYDELHVDTADFFRHIWWPFMRECADKYSLKYTGLIIESYGDQVKGPFVPTQGRQARDNLIVYGRELLDMGGELGLHGYNHQSLAPAGYNQDELDYVPWESKEDMVESLQELRRYIKSAYPDYDFQSYVPPSDILSPEGHEAVKEVFPELKVYSSLFDGLYSERGYYQDFGRNANGTYEIPRFTSGYAPDRQNMWENISVINYIGVFSHFVHPDELFYEESKDLTWAMMVQGFHNFLAEINDRFGWLRPVTDSECVAYFADYLDMDYRVTREQDKLILNCWNYHYPLRFVLRSSKEIAEVTGGSARKIGDDAYMIETEKPETIIQWKEKAK